MGPSGLAFKQEIQQMMYLAGEVQDPTVDTLAVIEDIIQQQIVHILFTANDLANRRGSRVFSNNDIIFQFRHNTARVERLRMFLTWKAIRKAVKEPDDKDALIEEVAMEVEAAGPLHDASTGSANVPVISLPWDVASFFSEQVLGGNNAAECFNNDAAIEKLRQNDERTRNMTLAEYATWSEYRHASFTWRKTKRFREWSGLNIIADNKPGDDVLDILGFLTAEMVQDLTAEALKIQQQELRAGEAHSVRGSTKPETAGGLFTRVDVVRPPVDTRHIRMAFLRKQTCPKQRRSALHNNTRQQPSSGLRLL